MGGGIDPHSQRRARRLIPGLDGDKPARTKSKCHLIGYFHIHVAEA